LVYNKVNKLNVDFNLTWDQLTIVLKNYFRENMPDSVSKMLQAGNDLLKHESQLIEDEYKQLRKNVNEMDLVFKQVQSEMRLLRLLPMSVLLGTLSRYVRDLSLDLKKEVNLEIDGDQVRIDKMVLDQLKDPVIHIVRNAIDHGIEFPEQREKLGKPKVGTIKINITEQSGLIAIAIADDGAGISTDSIKKTITKKNLATPDEINQMSSNDLQQFIFKSGFSTREIASTVSGRGIGLDVVKTNLEHIKGQVKVESVAGKGTTITLYVPLTLSSERGLLVKCGSIISAIPTHTVTRILTLSDKELMTVGGMPAINLDNKAVKLCTLSNLLDMTQGDIAVTDVVKVVIIENAGYKLAIHVDDILGERELVIKPLHKPMNNIPCVSGATLSESGNVIVVLNSRELIEKALAATSTINIVTSTETKIEKVAPHILVVDDSITTRTLEKNILESKNYQVTVAVNGQQAWELMQKNKFSIVITDVNMPVMDGIELTDRIKKSDKHKDVPVIIVTSLGTEADKKRGIDVGANAYVVKSDFESGALLDIIAQMV
jgi:two-component system chemotaxis sensor kinase CheA